MITLTAKASAVDTSTHGIQGRGEILNAKEEVELGIKALVEEKKMPYARAVVKFAKDNPDIWAEYEKQRTAKSSQ